MSPAPHLRVVQPPVIAGKLPPHDLEAEAAVLSAVILKPDTLAIVDRILKREHFYSEANGRIFEAATSLAVEGKPLDFVMVGSWLNDRGRLQQVGGLAYLTQIVDATPAISHVGAHAAVVLRKARLRALIATMQRRTAEAYGDVGDEEEFIAETSTAVDAAARSGAIAPGDVSLYEAAQEMAADIERERELARIGAQPGIQIGIPTLEKLTGGLHATDVTMLSAPTKGFKTTVAVAIAMTVAESTERYVIDGREHARRRGVAIFELEMPAKKLARLAACAIGNVPRDRFINGEATSVDYDRVLWGSREFENLPVRIDSRTDLTIDKLRSAVREKRIRLLRDFKAPLRLVVIDTIQILALSGNGDPDREQQLIDSTMRELRRISLEEEFSGISWLVLSQLNAEGKMRGSRAIEQHCTSWWDLRVTEDKGPCARPSMHSATVTVRLQREGRQGPNVTASTWINVGTGRVGDR